MSQLINFVKILFFTALVFGFLLLIFLWRLDADSTVTATDEEKKNAFESAQFEPSILANFDKYKELQTFLALNADAIVDYNDSIHIARELKFDTISRTALSKGDCYGFSINWNQNLASINESNNNFPLFIRAKLDSIIDYGVGRKNLTSFCVCKLKAVTIYVKTDRRETGLFVSHELLWNRAMERYSGYLNNKDSLINGNCVYRIGLTEHHGH
jgi:hypothetical protein